LLLSPIAGDVLLLRLFRLRFAASNFLEIRCCLIFAACGPGNCLTRIQQKDFKVHTLSQNNFRAVQGDLATQGFSVQDSDVAFPRPSQSLLHRENQLGLRREDCKTGVHGWVGLTESYSPPQPQDSAPADEDEFPLSALIWFVQLMRH